MKRKRIVSFEIDADILFSFKLVASKRNMSMSEMIRLYIQKELENEIINSLQKIKNNKNGKQNNIS